MHDMKCPNGTHYNPDADYCMANLTLEQFLLCIAAGVAIAVVANVISNYCRRNRQR